MGNLRDCLICGYYDEDGDGKDYIVEVDVNKLQEIVDKKYEEYKDFQTKIEQKIAIYELLKEEFTKNIEYEEFAVELKGGK